MFRLLTDPPLDGPTNMARDEALLDGVARDASPPTLRLYHWSSPTVSLGYFQSARDWIDGGEGLAGLPVVRRLTGGGAILHDLELTYSLTIPTHHPLVAGRPNDLYRIAHDAVAGAWASLGVDAVPCGVSDDSGPRHGPFLCFSRRHAFDLLVGGVKIAGSAQRRTRQAILQHGSIVVGSRFAAQPSPPIPMPPEDALRELRALIPLQFSEAIGEPLEAAAWSGSELAAAESLVAKYAGAAWTHRT